MRQLLVRLLCAPILFYQRYISPLTPPSCRFTPTCSAYALEAIRKQATTLYHSTPPATRPAQALAMTSIDFHTHDQQAPPPAIIQIPTDYLLHPNEWQPRPGATYSAGIHPWDVNPDAPLQHLFEGFEKLAARPETVAIGECGLDRLHGDYASQNAVFIRQAEYAEALSKPVIIHCVKANYPLRKSYRRNFAPAQSDAPSYEMDHPWLPRQRHHRLSTALGWPRPELRSEVQPKSRGSLSSRAATYGDRRQRRSTL